MGGNAFRSQDRPLFTPRMPLEVKQKVYAHAHAILLKLFRTVIEPAEAPGKPDYGDLDFIAACNDPTELPARDLVAKALNAERYISSGPDVSSYAVSWASAGVDDTDWRQRGIDSPKKDQDLGEAPIPYAQIDIHTCQMELLPWLVFHASYGDLSQILGSILRPYGLTVTDRGFCLRVEEIEHVHKDGSKIYLTRDPDVAMEYLGLSPKRYHSGFENVEQLFEWIAATRFFNPNVYVAREGKETAVDRRRKQTRPMFGCFVDEWVPQYLKVQNGSSKQEHRTYASRDEVFQAVLGRFDKLLEYEAMVRTYRAAGREREFWISATRLMPERIEGSERGQLAAYLKKCIKFVGGVPVATEETPEQWKKSMSKGAIKDEELLELISEDREEVVERAQERAQRRKEEVMAEVRAKKPAKAA